MRKFRSSFLQEASDRGFLYQSTNFELLDEKLCNGVCTAYVGFDATADCLHVGHLLPIFFLRLFQKHGHKGIAIFGGGTTKIGDPSFKNSMRPMLSNEQIDSNIDGMKECIIKFVNKGDCKHEIQYVNNADWLDELKYVDFLRTVGTHFSVNRMITFDSVKARLTDDNSISFMEFNYMLMQAYDFLKLYQNYGCDIQLGGQDQWGNIVCGVELIRKVCQHEGIGCTVPLLTTSDGKKMGKSVNGAVWLNEKKLSPYDFWQYWRNLPDDVIGKCLRLFTDLPISEIERLEVLRDSEINEAKKILADEVTKITHGEKALTEVRSAVQSLFEGGSKNAQNVPSVNVSQAELDEHISVIDIIIRYGAASSRGEAKKLLRGNGVVLGGSVIGEDYKLSDIDLGKKFVIGKKKMFLLSLKSE